MQCNGMNTFRTRHRGFSKQLSCLSSAGLNSSHVRLRLKQALYLCAAFSDLHSLYIMKYVTFYCWHIGGGRFVNTLEMEYLLYIKRVICFHLFDFQQIHDTVTQSRNVVTRIYTAV